MTVKLYKNGVLIKTVNKVTCIHGPVVTQTDKLHDMVLRLDKHTSTFRLYWQDGYDKILIYNPKQQVSETTIKFGTNDIHRYGKILMDLSKYNQWQTRLLAKLDILVLLAMSEDSITNYLKEIR